MAYIETGPHLDFQVRAGSLLSNPGTQLGTQSLY